VKNLSGKDRLIVALDVPSHKTAIKLVQALDNVSFFKIGLQLFLTGQVISLIQALRSERNGQVFLDIKWGGDIGNTAGEFMQACIESAIVKFITLVEAESKAITKQTIDSGKAARHAANAEYPHFLMVPCFSSLDSTDLKQTQGVSDLDNYILDRGKAMVDLGCDGLIVSGDAIKLCYENFGGKIDIVSPGIRPTWASHDDHKRFTTPARAIELGSDYLVVGRPIIENPNPRDAAQRIIDEIDQALDKKKPSSGSRGEPSHMAFAAKSPNWV
jgi:orotidine-5'-phosphate decarboxylase